MKNIIAFCGSKGSGKSTSALVFKELVTTAVEEIAIAGHLKEVSAAVFRIDYNCFIDPKLKEVELDEYIVLDSKRLEQVLIAFNLIGLDSDKYVRPHVGHIMRTPRQLLQYIGTEFLHPIDSLVHIKMAMRKKDPNKITLITDLRFVTEFNYLKDNHETDFLPVYVKNAAAELTASVDSHASERQYVEFVSRCRVLNNEGSLQDLRSNIDQMVKEL